MGVQIIILAAGVGKRMHSAKPKVMHMLAGKPLLEHVICTALSISPQIPPIIIYGHQGHKVREVFSHHNVKWVEQKEQLGTGHAVLQALPQIDKNDLVLILYGDVPLVSAPTLKKLIALASHQSLAMMVGNFPNPLGYGRIKRDRENNIIGIIEEKDASIAEKAITEINPGIYAVPAFYLQKWLSQLSNKNSQQEYYLTDIIQLAVKDNLTIAYQAPETLEEIMGVNDRLQLSQLERFYQKQCAENLMRQGVTLYDPARLDIRGSVRIGRDTIVDVNVIFEGDNIIGNDCYIGPNTFLRNVIMGNRVEVKSNSVIDGAEIADDCLIGPFARMRPGAVLAQRVHIGNFVEVKNSDIGDATKINHLSYIGDSEIGKRVNIGAGTITCNYDGLNKHKTKIEDDVQIGSDTQLVAPLHIGARATIGAGSTILQNVPAEQLTITQCLKQRTVPNWERPENKSTEKKC